MLTDVIVIGTLVPAATVAEVMETRTAVELWEAQEPIELEQVVEPDKVISVGTVTRMDEPETSLFTVVKDTVRVDVAPIELLEKAAEATLMVAVTEVSVTVLESTE